jgi:hypothetical protein
MSNSPFLPLYPLEIEKLRSYLASEHSAQVRIDDVDLLVVCVETYSLIALDQHHKIGTNDHGTRECSKCCRGKANPLKIAVICTLCGHSEFWKNVKEHLCCIANRMSKPLWLDKPKRKRSEEPIKKKKSKCQDSPKILSGSRSDLDQCASLNFEEEDFPSFTSMGISEQDSRDYSLKNKELIDNQSVDQVNTASYSFDQHFDYSDQFLVFPQE